MQYPLREQKLIVNLAVIIIQFLMKQYLLYVSIIAFFSCKNQPGAHTRQPAADSSSSTHAVGESKTDTAERTVHQHDSMYTTSEFKDFTPYKLTDTIVEDLKGDEAPEKAFLNKTATNKQLIITDGKTNVAMVIGSDASFQGMNDFDWVDFWGITKDKTTYEITFKKNGDIAGSKKADLEFPSIVLRRDEEGGGLVTYKHKKFIWVHQAD